MATASSTSRGGSNEAVNNGVLIATGNGNNTIAFSGTTNDAGTIKVGDGTNTITLGGQATGTISVGAGNNDILDHSTSSASISLGTGSNVLEFLAGAHATVSNFNAASDSIILHGLSASQVKMTNAGGATSIDLGSGASIHLTGVALAANASRITYA